MLKTQGDLIPCSGLRSPFGWKTRFAGRGRARAVRQQLSCGLLMPASDRAVTSFSEAFSDQVVFEQIASSVFATMGLMNRATRNLYTLRQMRLDHLRAEMRELRARQSLLARAAMPVSEEPVPDPEVEPTPAFEDAAPVPPPEEEVVVGEASVEEAGGALVEFACSGCSVMATASSGPSASGCLIRLASGGMLRTASQADTTSALRSGSP